MNENKNLRPMADDEFDIEVLASKLWSIYKKLIYKLSYPWRLLLSNPKKLLISLAIAMGLSIILRFTIPPVFESSFIIKPYLPTDQVSSSLLEDLNTMIKDDNYEDIARLLKVDQQQCEKLFKLSFYPYYKNEFRKDTIIGLHITLLLRDPRLIDTFQRAILENYLEGNEYYKRSISVRQRELDYMEQVLEKDIRENDSLKRIVTSNVLPRNGGGFVYGEPLDPQKIYQSGYDLQQQLIRLKTAKEYNQSFTLAKAGLVRLKPYFPRMIILFPVLALFAVIYCLITNARNHKPIKAT